MKIDNRIYNKRRIAGITALCLLMLLMITTLSGCAIFNKSSGGDADVAVTEDGTMGEAAAGDYGSLSSAAKPHGAVMDGPSDTNMGDGVPAYDPGGIQKQDGEAFVLTGGVWSDHDNWPFFTNLVNSGTISFPSFGLDPRNRIKVTVTDESGEPLRGERVELAGPDGKLIWAAKSGKDGAAYLFYTADDTPETIICNGVELNVADAAQAPEEGGQGEASAAVNDELTLAVSPAAPDKAGVQIMFIVDTTGSMSDELAFLQKDFAAIAEETGAGDVYFSTNFYRDEGDEYVTKTNGFTQDVQTVTAQLKAEYADGGGDEPEAVAQILEETMKSDGWRDDCSKIAFLIFDAPPHTQTEASIQASIRSAAEQGIVLVPVVASNAERGTELFGRAAAIMTGGTYVFLTDDSGVGESHLEPIVGDYNVELLHDIIVKVINDYR